MTTICASRSHGQMAADSLVALDHNGTSFPSPKIERIGHLLVGAAGRQLSIARFMAWMRAGCSNRSRPTLHDKDDQVGFEALVLSHKGLFYYGDDCVPQPVGRDYHAIGTGALSALTSLELGRTPKRSIEIAAKFDPNTGVPVTVLDLETRN